MQQHVLNGLHEMDQMGEHMNELMNEILKKDNLKTFQDLEEKVLKLLSSEDRESYLKVGLIGQYPSIYFVLMTYSILLFLEQVKKISDDTSNVFYWTLTISGLAVSGQLSMV